MIIKLKLLKNSSIKLPSLILSVSNQNYKKKGINSESFTQIPLKNNRTNYQSSE